MLQQSAAVIVVLALLIALLWFLRRKGFATVNMTLSKRSTRSKHIQVIERVPLTAHHSLHLVRIQDRLILVGLSPSTCTAFETFAAPAIDLKAEERP